MVEWKEGRVVVQAEEIDPLTRQLIEKLARGYLTSKEIGDKAKKEKKWFGQELQALTVAIRADTIKYGPFEVIKAHGRSGSKISETKLLQKGVSPDVIAQCWEGGKEYEYVQVKKIEPGKVGEGGDSEDEDGD